MSDCSTDDDAETTLFMEWSACPEDCKCEPWGGCGLKRTVAQVPEPNDPVNNPSHYASGAVECIDAIQASMSVEAFRGYCKGNVEKYVWRYETKGGVESLRKAEWYLKRLISTFDADA